MASPRSRSHPEARPPATRGPRRELSRPWYATGSSQHPPPGATHWRARHAPHRERSPAPSPARSVSDPTRRSSDLRSSTVTSRRCSARMLRYLAARSCRRRSGGQRRCSGNDRSCRRASGTGTNQLRGPGSGVSLRRGRRGHPEDATTDPRPHDDDVEVIPPAEILEEQSLPHRARRWTQSSHTCCLRTPRIASLAAVLYTPRSSLSVRAAVAGELADTAPPATSVRQSRPAIAPSPSCTTGPRARRGALGGCGVC